MIGFIFKEKKRLFITEQDILDSVEVRNKSIGNTLVSYIKQFIQANNIIDTGAYLNSVMFKTSQYQSQGEFAFFMSALKDQLLIGSGISYSVFIEDGTISMPPRPAFRYTIDTKLNIAQNIANAEAEKFLVRRANA